MKKLIIIGIAMFLVLTGALHAQAAVTGKVTLTGTPAKGDVPINAAADPKCAHGADFKTEHWKIGPGGELANVVVYVTGAPAGTPSAEKPVIDQKGCRYNPYVTPIQKGQTVTVVNSDDTLHNVHAKADAGAGKSLFNFGQPVKGMKTDKKFDAPGVIKLKCDVHPWMLSYVVVLDTPYFAVTKEDGTFALPAGLPDGDYTVEAWHSRFSKPLTQAVKVSGGNAEVNFNFEAAQAA
jgi:plastocyanin